MILADFQFYGSKLYANYPFMVRLLRCLKKIMNGITQNEILFWYIKNLQFCNQHNIPFFISNMTYFNLNNLPYS